MSQKARKKFIPFLLCLIFLAETLAGCGSSSSGLYLESTPSGYSQHTEVDGVTFAIPSSFTDSATAVSEVSENGDFKSDVTYEFTNGTDTYLLFNMDSLVIIVRKGTDFGFIDTDDKAQCLQQSSILSVQLDLPQRSKKLEYEEQSGNGVYKFLGTVMAEAVITRNVYGNFVGKVSSICIGNDEWTMFVGVPGTRYTRIDKTQKSVIETIAKSLAPVVKASDSSSTESDTESTDDADTTNTVTIIKGGKTATPTVKQNTGSVVSGNDNENAGTGSTGSASQPSDHTDITEPDPTTPETPSESDSTTSETISQGSSTEESQTDGNDEVKKDSDGETVGINMSNQKDAQADGDAFKSDIYSMLTVGQKGKAQVVSDEAGATIITVAVQLNTVTTGQQAVDTIKEYCASGNAGYAYQEPPIGTSWVVASYDVDYEGNPERPSVNSKLYGLNGKKLYLNGIGYSTRTYDMNYKAKDGMNQMVYFAVPINCKDYVLAFGDGNVDNLYQAAYYHISEK